MKTYIGTKIIQAEPQAKNYGPSEGQGQPGYKVVYPDGYTSWSPAAAFEGAYRNVQGGMTFGDAVHLLRLGHRVCRAGWDGKGMWLAYTPGSHIGRECIKPGHALSDIADEMPERDLFSISAHIDMRTADGSLMVGWTPNTLDMLADDWQALDVEAPAT